MEDLPVYIKIVFALTTFLTIMLFYIAATRSISSIVILIIWLGLQAFIGWSEFYTVTDTIPPRFLLLVGPPLFLIFILFVTKTGKQFIDHLDQRFLTLLHIVRIPVEIVLFWLFMHKAIPELMTFEGRNFDIVSGITAPFVYYFGFIKNTLSRTVLIVWNVICLCLLLNIVINAILSVPTPFQKFAFDQPNIAVLYFPFHWLPGCIVPLVLFAHLAALRQLLYNKSTSNTINRDF
jgi:hypothetical protein